MVDLVITPGLVIATGNVRIVQRIAAATITAGNMVYDVSASTTAGLADSNSATAAARTPIGVALNGASAGQPLAVATSGDITIGATMVAGVAYYLSDTPGGICPVADVLAGEYPCVVGMAISTTVLRLGIQSAGVAI